MLSAGSDSHRSIHANKIRWPKEDQGRERLQRAHLSSFSRMLMNPAMIYQSNRGRVKVNLW